ncbi:MAG: helix-turn-helix domain-containing protein [Bacteroidota bacterium]|nr:helix-turn-helix domain-containing protein [Bacteroidota bacterium]
MQVITIQSEAFHEIVNKLDEIKTKVLEEKGKQPLTDIWLDNTQVCELLKVSTRTMQTYRDEGIVSFSQVGSKIYYKASDIEAHLQRHYNKAFRR